MAGLFKVRFFSGLAGTVVVRLKTTQTKISKKLLPMLDGKVLSLKKYLRRKRKNLFYVRLQITQTCTWTAVSRPPARKKKEAA